MSYRRRSCADYPALAPFVQAVTAAFFDPQGQQWGRKRVQGSARFWEELRAGPSMAMRRGRRGSVEG